MQLWPKIVQHIRHHSISDHQPIVIFEQAVNRGPIPFKMFDYRMDFNSFDSLVSNFFDGNNQTDLWEKMRALKLKIKAWKKSNVGELPARIKEIEASMEKVEKESENCLLMEEHKCFLKEQIREPNLLYSMEEKEMIQKSRIRWAKEGDRNTKFFHQAVAARRIVNNISVLKEGDRLLSRQEEINDAFFHYFRRHFNSVETTPVQALNIGMMKLSPEKARKIEDSFSLNEIKAAVDCCDGSRAPGPDGYNINFFKKYWRFLKDDLKLILDKFHESGVFNKNINSSFISLLPKCQNPEMVEDYRPVSLVGSIYKIIAKILAIRLKPMMNELVGGNQFAYIDGRQIVDSVLIANEVIDMLRKNKEEGILIKLDFEKAYDSVSWDFLELVLNTMGFGSKWGRWIRCCVSTAKMSVLVNGSPGKEFCLSHGLRQGCLLSPMLFILVGEVFSRLTVKAEEAGWLDGIKVGRSNVSVSHLQYADDTLLFCRNSEGGLTKLKRMLNLFTVISGLKINFDKSSMIGVGGCFWMQN